MGYAHHPYYRRTCQTPEQLRAAFGPPLAREIPLEERVSAWGNPLLGGTTQPVPAVICPGTPAIRVHRLLTDKVLALFAKIQQLNHDYAIYELGSLCLRYRRDAGTRQAIRDSADYTALRDQHADWMRRWPSLAVDFDNRRQAVRWQSLSDHSFGTALDVNAPTNPHKAGKPFDMPPWLVAVFRDHGFSWEGYAHNAMHFVFAQRLPGSMVATRSPAPVKSGTRALPEPGLPALRTANPPPAAGAQTGFCTRCGKPLAAHAPAATTQPPAGQAAPAAAAACGTSSSPASAPAPTTQAAGVKAAQIARKLMADYQSNTANPPQHVQTYMRGKRVKMAWIPHPHPSVPPAVGGKQATCCNIFAYNVSHLAGLSVPTRHRRLSRPRPRQGPDGQTHMINETHGPLAPPTLGLFFVRNVKDRLGVRDRLQKLAQATQARPGDWVLYHHTRLDKWRHVDLVVAIQGTTAQGEIRLETIGAGGSEGREVHAILNVFAADGTLRERKSHSGRPSRCFDRVMVLRPTRLLPRDPATGRPAVAPNAM